MRLWFCQWLCVGLGTHLFVKVPRASEKIFQEGANGKNTENYQKITKIALCSLFQGRRKSTKKYRKKNTKKGWKIALFSLYLPYLYHVWKLGGPRARPLPSAADAHAGYLDQEINQSINQSINNSEVTFQSSSQAAACYSYYHSNQA